MPKYLCTQIQYDTEGADVSFPKFLIIDIPEEELDGCKEKVCLEAVLADAISDRTGFCVSNFCYDTLESKTYWLVDEQEHSLDHYGIVDAYDDGNLFDEGGNVNMETLGCFPHHSVIASDTATVSEIEDLYDIDYDFCVVSEKEAFAIAEAHGEDDPLDFFKDDGHWKTLEKWTEEQREEDEEEDDDDEND